MARGSACRPAAPLPGGRRPEAFAGNIFSVPGALLLTLVGGFLFGAFAGAAFTVIGATVGATLVFVFARAIFGANALDRFGPSAVSLAKALRKDAWSYLFVLRLIPLFSFFLVNLVPAFAGVGGDRLSNSRGAA